MNLNTKKLTLLIPFLAGIFVVKPVHAYAGPGVAIGAIIVFFTVIITFFASAFLGIFKFIKNRVKSFKKIKKKNPKKLNKEYKN